ncbi:hypothetical protein IFM89_008054 [Coptis chinensis]|uniref:Uncharacterized protein n=1 Tax=Coptis chinensis TaxID=261450 RepID=A0A835MHN9_9MAGN|nr:hypothetical protein IFM89_008054 [Coptis chinensis]
MMGNHMTSWKSWCPGQLLNGSSGAGGVEVFPKGSPLVPDISRAILNVTEGDKMDAIDREWFGQQVSCQEQGTTTSESLTLDSFKGLFMIAGVASAIAFLVFFIIFLYEHRNIITSECSVSQKISAMAVEFDKEKDISSRGSKKIDFLSARTTDGRESCVAECNVSTPQSPATIVCVHEDTVFSTEGSTPSTDHSTPIRDPPGVIEITSVN